jgi:hydrogenase maturation protein HypF
MGIAALSPKASAPRERMRLCVRGAVQGVGFRPFVYREAQALGLAGFVVNTPGGVSIEVEGAPEAIGSLVARIEREPPPNTRITDLAREALAPLGDTIFEIRESVLAGAPNATILPDLATCEDCRAEIFDPGNRRYRYPFTNCTNCGPRFSIITDLPYDRARTTMHAFPMCASCEAEYGDPGNRRFHAEPNACAACGPRLVLWNREGGPLEERFSALLEAAEALRRGEIVAVKGLGGFHLMVDAQNEAAVQRLRARKHREEKPFAVMFPSLTAVREACAVSHSEAALLTGPQRPIVLLRRRSDDLAAAVAPRNPFIGAILPYTPLHHLFLSELGSPIVATSGNLSDEPIVIDEREAPTRLAGIADCFLVHDRPILRPLDDSIARIVAGRPQILRRARGYAPLPVVAGDMPPGILALGGHLKTTIALSIGSGIVLSQHLGGLETAEAREAHGRAGDDVVRLYRTPPRLVAHDLHPDYHSSRLAGTMGLPTVAVQHHLAHVMACMAEHDLAPPVLGIAFDGTGYGTDGTVWGGEFVLVTDSGWRRVAHLRPFRLPGGEVAIREPRRAAFGLLYEAFGRDSLTMTDLLPIAAFSSAERNTLAAMIDRGLNAPVTTSTGRLFDAVAALTGLRQRASYEGQAAAELEWAIEDAGRAASDTSAQLSPRHSRESRNPEAQPSNQRRSPWTPAFVGVTMRGAAIAQRLPSGGGSLAARLSGTNTTPYGRAYVFALRDAAMPEGSLVVDWERALRAILVDIHGGVKTATISANFHAGLAAVIGDVATRVGEPKVVLTGGCFQNTRLTEATIETLRAAGVTPYWHERVPPNDGGLALGQAVWAARMIEKGQASCA